eukprot:804892-Prymnesium_polylepis.1
MKRVRLLISARSVQFRHRFKGHSALPLVANVDDGLVRRKYGYFLPSLNAGLSEIGEMMGTSDAPATSAAVIDASEQPAPMIALTPVPLKTSRASRSAPTRALAISHLES